MKKLILTSLFLSAAGIALAQPPAGKAKPGDNYGAATDSKNAIPAKELPAMLANKDTVPVKVMARVLDVCPKKGCWASVQINDSTQAFIKMKDYAFFVPTALIGKNIVVDGISFTKTTSVSELKHYAEDAKKSQKEIDAITQPKKEIRLLASGIVVVE